ncbi:sulfite oxidase heme-binding subunit YedZ [Tabrizicola sp.]|uniref:sulfite oxidase heme-binding subunit YedZ n=1 Tax=Tabrizicola sp. TaxID=2005166 RepID=UPI003D265EA5
MKAAAQALTQKLPISAVYLMGALPGLWLIIAAVQDRLGPDPVKALEHGFGLWALRLFLATLCITPFMRLGLRFVRFRRALGLMAFFYALLHVATWAVLDMGLRWDEIAKDLWKRPYIVAGLIGFLLMLPLALTSTNAAIRRMGAPSWRRLHRLAYPAILAVCVHGVMVTKVWEAESLVYLSLGLVLLALRLPMLSKRPAQKP